MMFRVKIMLDVELSSMCVCVCMWLHKFQIMYVKWSLYLSPTFRLLQGNDLLYVRGEDHKFVAKFEVFTAVFWVFRTWCVVWCVVASTSGASCSYPPWMRSHYIRFKYQETFAQWHSITSQKTWMLKACYFECTF